MSRRPRRAARFRAAATIAALAVAVPAFAPADDSDGRTSPSSLESALRTHLHELSVVIGERNAGRPDSLERARDYVAGAFARSGCPAASLAYEAAGRTFHNVECVLGDPDAPSIVVGAHYDSVSGSPGANDNASGVAAVLELARLFRAAPPSGTVRLVAFANEEPPWFARGDGMGSVAYVGRFADPKKTVRFMLSIETIGYYTDEPNSQRYPEGVRDVYPDTGSFVAVIANERSAAVLRQLLDDLRREAAIAIEGGVFPESIPGVAWSDHRSFWNAGVPALMITDTAVYRDPSYHRSTDTPDRLDVPRMAKLVRALANVVRRQAAGAGR